MPQHTPRVLDTMRACQARVTGAGRCASSGATVEGVGKGAKCSTRSVTGETRIPLTLALVAVILLQLLLPKSIVVIHERGCFPRCSPRLLSR